METEHPAQRSGERESAPVDMCHHALQYAGSGLRVLPLHAVTPTGCACGKPECSSPGKHPRNFNGATGGTVDSATIRQWWTKWPSANIGIATGPESGLLVLDIDGVAGWDSLDALGVPRPPLSVLTGRVESNGDRVSGHCYFRWPHGTMMGSSVANLGRGLDVRGKGSYVVAPPSTHASGAPYEWLNGPHDLIDAPTWLVAPSARHLPGALPKRETQILQQGERNKELYRLACGWRRKGASPQELRQRLLAHNRRYSRPPLLDEEVSDIARNASLHPVGGPDPLELAWQRASVEGHRFTYDRFLALAKELQHSRPGLPILLPVERVAKLIGCDRTLVGRHCTRAIQSGLLHRVTRYVAKKAASSFRVLIP